MSKFYFFITIVIVVLLIGCTKENSTAPKVLTDQSAIKQQVTEIDSIADFSLSDEATINDGGVQEWDVDGMAKFTSPINPILWGRKIDNIQKTVTVVIDGDTVATATIEKIMTGRLIVLFMYPDTVKLDTVQKQFTMEVRRKVKFVRVARSDDVRMNWKPTAITTVLGQTSVKNFNVSQVIVYTPHDTILIMEPLMQWFYYRELQNHIPIMDVGDTVKIRVKIASQDTNKEYVMLRHCVDHRFTHRYRTRMGLVDSAMNQGMYEREYEKRFVVRLPIGTNIGRFNAVLDVISYESLNDDTAPFSNMILGVPYIVKK